MKNSLSLVLLIIFTTLSFSQVTPEAFLGLFPVIPDNSCSDEFDVYNIFCVKVDSISELIEISRRDEENEAKASGDEKQVMDNISERYGLSQQEIENLQNDEELTEEEQEALISKAMQNKDNISLDEVKNLDKLNKEGSNAWSEAYGDQKMAEIQYDPEQNMEMQLENKNLYELGALKKHILDSLKSVESIFAQKFAEIDKDPEAIKMLDKINKLEQEATSMMGELSADRRAKLDAITQQMKLEKDKYCNKYSPMYLNLLMQFESFTKSCLPVCYRLEAISAKISKLQTGVEMKQEYGRIGIGKVADYLGRLRGVYKYNLNKN